MLFAFPKGSQYAPNTVGGRLVLCQEVYNPRGCFIVTRFTSPRDTCERCHFGMPEKAAYGDPKGRNGRLFVPTTGEQDPRVARRPVACRARALARRSAVPAEGESGTRMRPEFPLSSGTLRVGDAEIEPATSAV